MATLVRLIKGGAAGALVFVMTSGAAAPDEGHGPVDAPTALPPISLGRGALLQGRCEAEDFEDEVAFLQSGVTVSTGIRRVGSGTPASESDARKLCDAAEGTMSTQMDDNMEYGDQVVMMQGAVSLDAGVRRVGVAGFVFEDRRGQAQCEGPLADPHGEGGADYLLGDVFSLIQTEVALDVGAGRAAAHSTGEADIDHISVIQSQVTVNRGERHVGYGFSDEGEDVLDSAMGAYELSEDEIDDGTSMIQERVSCGMPSEVPEGMPSEVPEDDMAFDVIALTQTTLVVEQRSDEDDKHGIGGHVGGDSDKEGGDVTSLLQRHVGLGSSNEDEDALESAMGGCEFYQVKIDNSTSMIQDNSTSMIQERVSCGLPAELPEEDEEMIFDDSTFTQTTLVVEQRSDEDDTQDTGGNCVNAGHGGGDRDKDDDDFTSFLQMSVTVGRGVRRVGVPPGEATCVGGNGCDDDDEDDGVALLQAEVTLGQGCRGGRPCSRTYDEDEETDVFSF